MSQSGIRLKEVAAPPATPPADYVEIYVEAGAPGTVKAKKDTGAIVDLEAGGGGGVSDGDKGDITVSGGGSTWTVDADAVTFAKMQDIGTDRLIGRDTAATGNPEELTVGGGLEFTGAGGIQRAALTGDVTAAAGSGATTIANDAVSYAKMQNVSATDKVLGRATAGAGDVEEIACTGAGRALIDDADAAAQRTTLGLGALATKSSIATGDIDADAVTYAKMQNVSATDRLLGRDTAGAGDAEELTVGGGLEFTGSGGIQRSALTGDVTASAGSASTTIANDAVTNAKLANMAANSVKVRNAGTSGDPSDAASADLTTGSPASGDFLLGWESTGELRKFDVGALPTGGGGEANTASNVGTGGVGVFKQKTGINLEFKNVNAGSTKITVTDDTGTNEIDIDVAQANLDLGSIGGQLDGGTQVVANSVGNAQLRTSAAMSVVGRASGTGNVADIVAAADGQVLRRSGTTVGFGTTATAGIADNAVTDAKLRDSAATSVIGRSGATSGDPADIAASADGQVLRQAGGALGFGAVDLADSDAVTGTLPSGNLPSAVVLDTDANTYTAGQKQSFTHDATNAGLRVVPATGDPSTPSDGDIWYSSSTNTFRKRQNGVTTDMDTTGGGGVSDGDKGDITVSGSGTIWTIDTDAVTYAKIQNVSATDKVLGRSTVGAGDVEEIACTSAGRALIDDADASAQRTTLGLGALATKSTVDTADITADAVTYAKLQNLATDRLLGRDTAATGDAEELTVGGGIAFTGSAGITIDTTVITGQTEDTTPDAANDMVLTYDNSAAALKKVKITNLGGGGDNISVNGTACTNADLDDATPAAPAGGTNVKWAKDTSAPDNVSAYMDWGKVMDQIRRKPFYFYDFGQQGTTGLPGPWSYQTVSGSATSTTGTANHPGIFRFSSGAGANTGAVLLGATGAYLLGGGETIEVVFNITTLTNTLIRIGFIDTASSTQPTDGAWIEIPSTGAAVLITKNNAGPTTSSTIATLSTATWYRARVSVNSDATSVTGEIWNDSGTSQGSQSNTANIPTASGRECGSAFLALSQSTVVIVDVDYIAQWQDTRALTR